MFTKIYQTSFFFRLISVALVIFVLSATSLPIGHGLTSSVYAMGHPDDPPDEPMDEPAEPMHEQEAPKSGAE